jgi:hypothetical protein
MNLIERSITFAESAKELDGLKKAANLVSLVASRAQQFEAALGELRLAVGRLALLRKRGLTVDVDVSPAKGFAHHLAALKDSTTLDPTAVTISDVATKTLTPLKAFAGTVTEACNKAWRGHVAACLPRVGDLVPVLARVPAQKTRVERFQTLQATARARANAVPTSISDVEAFEQAASASHTAWNALDADDIPLSVTRFLRNATSEGGAGLDSLTDEVITWLRAQDLIASFAIRAR